MVARGSTSRREAPDVRGGTVPRRVHVRQGRDIHSDHCRDSLRRSLRVRCETSRLGIETHSKIRLCLRRESPWSPFAALRVTLTIDRPRGGSCAVGSRHAVQTFLRDILYLGNVVLLLPPQVAASRILHPAASHRSFPCSIRTGIVEGSCGPGADANRNPPPSRARALTTDAIVRPVAPEPLMDTILREVAGSRRMRRPVCKSSSRGSWTGRSSRGTTGLRRQPPAFRYRHHRKTAAMCVRYTLTGLKAVFSSCARLRGKN